MAMMRPPAARLEGEYLEGGWFVARAITRQAGATGGNFSFGYLAQNEDGREAFLKALDLSEAFGKPKPLEALGHLTRAANHERNLLRIVDRERMSNVIRLIGDGTHSLPNGSPYEIIPYFLFELASGDVRNMLQATSGVDWAWAFRSCHAIAVGLSQLHQARIAHQDLKPSNVLLCGDDKCKITDLGRSSIESEWGPWDHLDYPGDWTYLPPEFICEEIQPCWYTRRIACDVYALGSMLVFYATMSGATPALRSYLHPAHYPEKWIGDYSGVLPHLQHSFSQVLAATRRGVPSRFADQYVSLVQRLCEPDYRVRGDRTDGDQPSKRMSLQRVVSELDLLATRAEISMRASK
jgi:serine/threonine protein kinase